MEYLMSYSVKQAKAAVVEWFELLGETSDDAIVQAIEHDRLDYSLRPGLVRKLLLLATDDQTAQTSAGGAYFFEGFQEAKEFLNWASHEHRDVEGHVFEERDYVGKRDAYVCEVLAHVESAQPTCVPAVVHVERFELERKDDRSKIINSIEKCENVLRYSEVLSISFLHDPDADNYFFVTVRRRDRNGERDHLPDLPALPSDATATVMTGTPFAKSGDWRFWVFTIWEPRLRTDPSGEAVWPNSPPLPSPAYWPADGRGQ